MSALLNVKQFVRFDEHGNLHVPNKLFVACQAYVQTPFLNDTSSRVATTEWVRAQIVGLTNVPLSETDPIWVFEKALYYTKLQADARYLQSFTETDPTVSAWAKASVKPTYTFAELLSKPTTIAGYGITDIPTTLPASDVYAWAKAATKPSYAYSEITGLPTLFSGSYTDLTNKPTIPTYTLSGLGGQPLDADLTAIAALSGTAGFLKKTAADTWALDNNTYLTSYTETDPIWTAEKTNYALKTYVDTSISNLVASAPATLNTLNELALALGSDANFSTTVATSIGNKVPYTGATANVDLGTRLLLAENVIINTANYITPIDLVAINSGGTVARVSVSNVLAHLGISPSSYVPYTGATQSVSLGLNNLSAQQININGNGTNNANLYLKQGIASLVIADGFSNILATGTKIGFQVATSAIAAYYADFQFSSLTAQRTYTLPDLSGTLALLEGSQTFSGAKTFSAATKLDGSLLLKDGATISTTSGYGALTFVKATTQSSLYLTSDTAYTSALIFNNASSYNYTYPASSGTIALTSNLSAYVPTTRTLTINGTALDLSADRAWTITTASTYTLPNASTTVLGGIKVGTNLSIDANGVLSSTDTNTTYSAFTGATASVNGTSGLVTAPLIANRGQYLRGDGTWATPPDTDTDTIYVHPTTAGNKHIPAGGSSGQILRWSADGAAAWGADVDTDTNTWDANSKTVAGYVSAPGAVAHKVWKTDASGNPGWRDDADTDTDTNTTYTASTGLTLTGTAFSITDTITTAATANTIAKRDGSAVISAGGFYQTSSKTLKTSIIDYNESALDIINKINVVSFYYKADVKNKRIGFIAEDSPEEVATIDHNVMDTNSTVGLLLKAIQQLEARIKVLENV